MSIVHFHNLLERKKKEAENEEEIGRLRSQNDALKQELVESKRQLEVKTKAENEKSAGETSPLHAASAMKDAVPKAVGQLNMQAAKASQGSVDL